ncbi:hypothetical protein BX600DRAFT_429197 [Xylariales sp. PMI_506]|nr:hypothetical protein BX600DRAFT_429197 [Xylariales sp. PMI_506]
MPEQIYRIRYIRHAKSQSNMPENRGVHIMDPLLTNLSMEQSWKRHGYWPNAPQSIEPKGREFATRYMVPMFADHQRNGTQSTVFLISPLTRVISTFLIAVPYETLTTAKIIFSPLLVEQTRWFSDRVRNTDEIKLLIAAELDQRDPPPGQPRLTMQDLERNIDFSRLIQCRDDDGDLLEFREEVCHNTRQQPWQLKDRFWHPRKLIERGLLATQEIIQVCRDSRGAAGYKDYTVCVFGHGGFVNFLVEEVGDGLYLPLGVHQHPVLTTWTTGELREYEVIDLDDSKDPTSHLLREVEECREKRLVKKWLTEHPGMRERDVPCASLKWYDVNEETEKRNCQRDFIVNQDYRGRNSEIRKLYDEADQKGRNPAAVEGSRRKYLQNVDGNYDEL